MRRSRIAFILVLGLLGFAVGYAEQTPKELIQYIRDARSAGLKESQIEQNALQAGWPAAIVTDAMRDSRQVSNPAVQEQEKAEDRKPDLAPEAKKVAGTPPQTAPPAPATPQQPPFPAPAEKAPQSPAAQLPPPQTAPAGSSARPEGATAETAEKAPPKVDRGVPDDYVIGEGDVLHISVWKEPDASVQSAVVRPDGKISMPMLKDVQVSGLTPSQAEKTITEQLVKFINAADVTVIVSAINSKRIYVVGAVKKEGPIPYTYRMTVLQALSEAGGLTDYAKRKRIYVLRHENGRDYQLPFDYDAVLRGEHMELNIPLMPGDTLVVPK